MIDKLHIKNFKSHSDSPIPLGSINLFTGMNGMGKSSAIQSLLLLRQTHMRGLLNRGLELNGELCSIGTVNDAIYRFSEDSDNIDFIINQNGQKHVFSFKADASKIKDTFAPLNAPGGGNISDCNLFNNGFQYISAYRNGPVNDYEKDTASVELMNQISRKEGRCELVAHYLDYFKDYEVHPDLIKNAEVSNSVKSQVEEWLKEISPNININIQPKDTSFVITYDFSRGKGLTKLEGVKASNTGFGVSYVLPIVVSAIVAVSRPRAQDATFSTNERLIVIENPEAHIHPNAQAKLMELICKAAKKGVQFIIETHSDHIINGLLVAIKKDESMLTKSKIYYFNRTENTHATKAELLQILPGGRIKSRPEGFFDQMGKDIRTLI